MAQRVEENVVKAAKEAMSLTEELKEATTIQVNKVLKTHMEVKREQGSSEVAALDVGASVSGNLISNTLNPLNDKLRK